MDGTVHVTTLWDRTSVLARRVMTAQLANLMLTNVILGLARIKVLVMTFQDRTAVIAEKDTQAKTVNMK